MKVPLNDLKRQYETIKPAIDEQIASVVASQWFIMGPKVEELEAKVAARCKVKHAIGCASGSDALLLALMALDVGPGDEVVTTPFTFGATALAISRLGARPVFVDIDPGTFNISTAAVRKAIGPRTKAIIPVHLYGRVADMDGLLSVAADAGGIPVVEDAAQSLGAHLGGRPAGSLGRISCFSFYPTKNLGAYGDAGLVATQDDALAARLRRLRVHGAGKTYFYDEVGANSRLDAIQAAVLLAKWPHLDPWNDTRRRIALELNAELARRAPALVVPEIPDGHIVHCYTVRVPDGRRDALAAHLKAAGIGTQVYYPQPLHLAACWKGLGYREGDLPEAERATREALSLPMFAEMREDEVEAVVAAVASFYAGSAAK